MQGVQIKRRQYMIDEQTSFNTISLISAILVVLDHEEEKKLRFFLSQTFFFCQYVATLHRTMGVDSIPHKSIFYL